MVQIGQNYANKKRRRGGPAKKRFRRRAARGQSGSWLRHLWKPGITGNIVSSIGIPALKSALGLNTETKRKDTDLTDATVNETSQYFALSGMAQGDDYDVRQGRSIRIKGIHVRFKVARHANDTSLLTTFRCLIVQDRNIGSSSVPVLTTILNTIEDTSLRTPQYDNMIRFKVHKDITLLLKKDENELGFVDVYIPLNAVTFYSGTGATDFGRNNFFLYYFSDNSDGTNFPVMTGTGRVYFVDN